MKKQLIKINIKAGLLALLVMVASCTDLEEDIHSEILKDNYYKNETEFIAAIAPAYGGLRGYSGDVWALNTHSTDHTLIPTRGRHWYDGGHWQRVHEHTWTSETPQINGAWGYGFDRVNKANQLIYQIAQIEADVDPALKEQFLAELKLIRAFGYYQLIDFFGNVPIVDRFDVEPGFQPTNNTRQEVFEFIENDIISSIDKLSENVDADTYGRFHKYAAYALLAKLYLNAEVYTGNPRWDDCVAACNQIINSEKFSLESNYFNNFVAKNESSKETIFAIPYDDVYTQWGLILPWLTLHYANQKTFNLSNGPWNGFCAVPSFVKSFAEEDRRVNGWLTGPQYSSTGERLLCSEESAPQPLTLTIDFVSLTDGEQYDYKNALEYHGARFVKFEITPVTQWCMENDLPVYRYADILMMKAECLMRKNGEQATPEAVDLVNQVRSRAFEDPEGKLYTTATLDLEALLAERGWEFYGEAMRRNDLIRFGEYIKGDWEFYDRSNEQEYRNIFPIPQPRINANPNLQQNPGY
ncbi:MAG: RagB/SusD family nutrient uptake outer membrane protein [Candidatus Cyclobacteriaceae bacterium M3_2C_046]